MRSRRPSIRTACATSSGRGATADRRTTGLHVWRPAWTLDHASGEYYLHLYAPEQPDLDWHEPRVRADFEGILRFWLDRGVDGFRIDVAHGLFKDTPLRDEPELPGGSLLERLAHRDRSARGSPALPPVAAARRRLPRRAGPRRRGDVLRPGARGAVPAHDELHLAFNFTLLEPWDADAMRGAIAATLAALEPVGATATGAREPRRHACAHALRRPPPRSRRRAAAPRAARHGIPLRRAGARLARGRAPDHLRQTPVFLCSGGARKGRDGCRVPIPGRRSGRGTASPRARRGYRSPTPSGRSPSRSRRRTARRA